MKWLLDIALGKSKITLIYAGVTVAVMVYAYTSQSEVVINTALVLVVIFGIFIVISGIVTTHEAIESLQWPKTKATLGICKPTLHLGGGDAGDSSYTVTVNYSFEVDGKTYHGNQYILGDRTYSKTQAEEIVNSIKAKADNLNISYNPDDPNTNVVKPGVNDIHHIRIIVGLAIVTFSVFELFGWSQFT